MTTEAAGSTFGSYYMQASPYLAIFSAASGAIGSYYQAKSQASNLAYQTKAANLQYQFESLNRSYLTAVRQYEANTQAYQLKSEAGNLQMQSSISQVNARMAEADAQQILLAGQREEAQTTAKYGKAISSTRASMAARGIALGEGSAADVVTAMDLAKQQDALTINANSTRAAASMRMQGLNYQLQGKMQDISAQNMLTSAENVFIPMDTFTPSFASYTPSINAGTAAFNSLLGSASNIANAWYTSSKYLKGTG